MKLSYAAAGLLILALVLWMSSVHIYPNDNTTDGATGSVNTDSAAGDNTALMKVQVSPARLQAMTRELTLQGQLEPDRHILIRSGTEGQVQELHVSKGTRAKSGDLLVSLALQGRKSRLVEARARVKTALSEQSAATNLRKQGLQSQLQLETAQAKLATAYANLERIKQDIADTEIRAPFDGIINALSVEIGEQVDKGATIAEIVDDKNLIASASVAQQSISLLHKGQPLTAQLLTGATLSGNISFISAVADSSTRSFRIEANIDNSSATLAAGVSATLILPIETIQALFVSPSTILLGNAGELGVKTVDANDIVSFVPIELVRSNSDGAWVTGIPEDARVITLGQGFVNAGERVTPIAKPLRNDAAAATQEVQ